jgi:hypothetical protein
VLINTGDLIAVRSVHNFLGTMTQFFTRSKYTHVGLAIWLGGDLFMAELNGGRNHLIPMSQLDDYDVYAQPEGLVDVDASIRHWLSMQVSYGFIALVAIGLLDWFRIKTFVHWRQILVCSGYCVAIWEGAGWPEHTRILSPAELTRGLKLKDIVRPS